MNKPHVDKHIFFICLVISIVLFIGGFFCPPMGQIDGSVLTAGGILFGFAALGVLTTDETQTVKKELRLVSWNGSSPVYEIRGWRYYRRIR